MWRHGTIGLAVLAAVGVALAAVISYPALRGEPTADPVRDQAGAAQHGHGGAGSFGSY